MTDKTAYKQYILDNAFGWQVDRPVFVKVPFSAFGKQWKSGDHFNWNNETFRESDYEKILHAVYALYNVGKLHHDTAKEGQVKVGDRLGEMKPFHLDKLVRQMNAIIKKRCVTDKEFREKKIKGSRIADKQRGLLRQWIYRNHWALEEFTKIRDDILDRVENMTPSEEEEPKKEVQE